MDTPSPRLLKLLETLADLNPGTRSEATIGPGMLLHLRTEAAALLAELKP